LIQAGGSVLLFLPGVPFDPVGPFREDDDGNTDPDGPHWRQSPSFQPK